MLTSTQIRAARAVLNWSQTELAGLAGISLATVRKIETDAISPRNTTLEAIGRVLNAAGLEFIDMDGVRRKPSNLIVFEGKNGGKDFFEDLRHTTNRSGGEIHIISPTTEAFARYCGLPDILKLDALIDHNNTVEIKVLLTDTLEAPLSTPRFQFRTISKNFVNPVPFCSYGHKYAIAVPNGEPFSKLVVIEASKMAITARQHFMSIWDKAMSPCAYEPQPATARRISAN